MYSRLPTMESCFTIVPNGAEVRLGAVLLATMTKIKNGVTAIVLIPLNAEVRFKFQYSNLSLEKSSLRESAISVLFEKYFLKYETKRCKMFSLIVIHFENIQHFDTEPMWCLISTIF